MFIIVFIMFIMVFDRVFFSDFMSLFSVKKCLIENKLYLDRKPKKSSISFGSHEDKNPTRYTNKWTTWLITITSIESKSLIRKSKRKNQRRFCVAKKKTQFRFSN